MKIETTYITKLILTKPFTYCKGLVSERTLKPGTILETRKHRKHFYYVWRHRIVKGHGDCELVPVDSLTVKWFKEIRTMTVEMQEVDVK